MNEDLRKQTLAHVTIMMSHLNNNVKLTNLECRQLVYDLKKISISPATSKKPEDDTVNYSIEELFEQFQETADTSKHKLEGIISTISEGKVPKTDSIDEMNLSIETLRDKFTAVYQKALEELPTDEVPEEDSSVEAYVNAIKNSKSLKYKERLTEIQEVLLEFVSVRSLLETYSSALEPYQQAAEALIETIKDSSELELDSITKDALGPELFVRALKCEDTDTEEGMELLDQVGEQFSNRVTIGIAKKKYFIGKSDGIVSEEIIPEKENSTREVNLEGRVEDKTIKSEMECEQSETTQELTSTSSVPGSDNNVVSDNNKAVSEDSEFVQLLKMNNVLIPENEELGIFRIDIRQAEDKKVSSSVFRNEMRQSNEKAEKAILSDLLNRCGISREWFTEVHGMPQAVIDTSLEYLLRKGYIRKYELIPGGEIFCASKRLRKAMSYKESSKYIGFHQISSEEWGTPITDKSINAAARIAYIRLLTESASNCYVKDGKTFGETSTFLSSAFVTGIYEADTLDNGVLLIGAFWNDAEECDEFKDALNKRLESNNKYIRAIIASIDIDHAKALGETVEAIIGGKKLAVKSIYLFGLRDNEYGLYPSLKKVENIWNDIDDTEANSGHMADGDDRINEKVFDNDEKRQEPETEEEIMEEQEIKETTLFENIEKMSEQDLSEADIEMKENNKQKNEIDKTDIVRATACDLITEKRFYAATAYLKVISSANHDYELLYNQLAYAVNDPLKHCIYSTEGKFNLITENSWLEDCMIISMAIRIFFSNQVKYDYNIKSFYNDIKDNIVLAEMSGLSESVSILKDFKVDQGKGIDAYADYHVKNQNDFLRDTAVLKQEAKSFYDNYIAGKKKESASQKRFIETKKLLFSTTSELGEYIKAVADDDKIRKPEIATFLQKNFYAEESTVSEDTIDENKLWDYIVVYWDCAGEAMMYRKHVNLMSHLRSNIVNTTTKVVQILAKWCRLVDENNNITEDEGLIKYRKVRKGLIENIEKAKAELNFKLCKEKARQEEKAGIQLILESIDEVEECINGSGRKFDRKYFYLPFLLTDDVMLDDNYLPDLDVHYSLLKMIQPEYRILEHVNNIRNNNIDYEKRLKEILDKREDNYGCAKLIVDYLKQTQPIDDLDTASNIIISGVSYAKESAVVGKTNFIGELELAQTYGQIDNSTEDKKERILQIIDKWYEWANKTSNYGFFRKVMKCYLDEIKESAKIREKDLHDQLESIKSTEISGISTDEKARKIAHIEAMIHEQNYTVAEDLLTRFSASEENYDDLTDEDFLNEFLENYDDYYRPVAPQRVTFASLVSSKTRNKDERGAKRLADNWLPGGSDLGKEKLSMLLSCFGFTIESIKVQSRIGKFENYFVQTKASKNARQKNYSHPIAAFGSSAAQEGFRVVCINGSYDADGLIDVMKLIGNAKHSLILLDCALTKSERRRLARKTKSSLGDKLFAVVDRAIMMFLIRNYDETKITRMLVSLITPFGYYQPYVWESSNVMPPEIFMGRKKELERIESATGVNIVYGGRQLGKSALLKKAKDDIDHDENGDRAVYIDVKGLTFAETAKKVGHELYDQSVIEEDIDSEDWELLARAIKKRLRQTSKPIPYLLLLLDEADKFIDSSGSINYKPLDILKDIQSIGIGRFKFVVAGLRNIVRFKREIALGNNSVITHLEPMTVKPFNTTEARELMEIPLHYLGLKFTKEKESLITLILATTNYFPGLIQLYCAKMIEAMRNKDYAGYDEVDSPIYEVSEKHIKKVLSDPEFMQQIREKFFITLKLDEDNYYYLIALLMAYLYHNSAKNVGYSAADISDIGKELGITRIADMEEKTLLAFMEELEELNVLRHTDELHFLFARFAFFQMMGTRAEVDDKIEEYMSD